MNILLIAVGLMWLGFCVCLVAFFWARPRKGESDPFLAATSGGDARNTQNRDLEDTLRQIDDDRITQQRDALRGNIVRGAPKAMAGFVILLVALFAAYQLGLFSSGREHRNVSSAAFGFGTGKSGFSWGNKSFYVRAGQSIEVNYGIQSGAGRLYLSLNPALHLLQPGAFDKPPMWSQTAQSIGAWSVAVSVPQSGYYRLRIWPTPARGGNMVYDVTWKVR